jgi:hypothetical protein
MLAALVLLFAPLAGPSAWIEKGAVVLVFVRSDCPISNRYAPELQRLYQQYSPQGIDFRLVYPEPGMTSAAMEAHLREFGYTIPAVLDPKHEYAGRARARVTPQAAVFVGGQPVYLGRVDDRDVGTGKARQSAAHHDLEEVLAEVAAGKIPRLRETKAIGCAIENPQ